MRFILATHTREIRSSLFLALNAMDHANIVATANSTGELINYCRALRPDIVVIEDLLPGSSLSEVVDEIRGLVEEAQILIVDGAIYNLTPTLSGDRALVELPAVGERRAGTASGLFFSCAEVGGVAGPVLIGILNDRSGSFDAGLYALALLSGGLLIASLRLRRRQQK